MPIGGPVLASCSAMSPETLSVHVGPPEGGDQYVFAVKDHRGAPWRELEVFTAQEIVDGVGGPLFYNIDPVRVPILDQTFRLVSGYSPSTNIVRFYWNPGGLPEIRTIDYDVSVKQAVNPVPSILSFQGFDPFIADARPLVRPQPFLWSWDGTDIVLGNTTLITDADEVKLDSHGTFFSVQSILDAGRLRLTTSVGVPTGMGPSSARAEVSGADNRVYLMYVKDDGSNAVRQSFDLGASWGSETVFDPPATAVELAEANPNDAFGAMETFQVAQKRA